MLKMQNKSSDSVWACWRSVWSALFILCFCLFLFLCVVMKICRVWPVWWAWSRPILAIWMILRKRMRKMKRTEWTRRRRQPRSQVRLAWFHMKTLYRWIWYVCTNTSPQSFSVSSCFFFLFCSFVSSVPVLIVCTVVYCSTNAVKLGFFCILFYSVMFVELFCFIVSSIIFYLTFNWFYSILFLFFYLSYHIIFVFYFV